MCTAIHWNGFFGRTLDLEASLREQIVVTPRNFPLPFRRLGRMNSHYAMIGVAHVEDGYPLYYDAVNEKGLAMAGLNFPGNACYHDARPDRDNTAPFELIPWILGQCASVDEAKRMLKQVRVVDEIFSATLPQTPLHWMIADRELSVVAEPMEDGLRVYENPVGVMTNSPPFPRQANEAEEFARLTPVEPEPDESDREAVSRGRGALGLPGDWSSSSRFVRAGFVRKCAVHGGVEQFFRMFDAVAVPEGCIALRDGGQVRTVYTSACDLERGLYYYTTYESHRIRCVSLCREHLDGTVLACYPLRREADIQTEN
jgi:choloylglycine hydrolase